MASEPSPGPGPWPYLVAFLLASMIGVSLTFLTIAITHPDVVVSEETR